MAEKKKAFKFPKSMGACADLLMQVRDNRLAAQKKVDEMEAEEKALKDWIINNLPKSESTGASGKIANVQVKTKEVPQVNDWDLFYKHIKKTGEFDLLSRAVSQSAIKERWENNKKVPGVITFNAVTLSLTKVK